MIFGASVFALFGVAYARLPAVTRLFVSKLLLLRFGNDRRNFRRAIALVKRYKSKIGRDYVPVFAGLEILGDNLYAYLHRCIPGAVKRGFEDQNLPHVRRRQKVKRVDRYGRADVLAMSFRNDEGNAV